MAIMCGPPLALSHAARNSFVFNNPAPTEYYTLSYTTLFRSRAVQQHARLLAVLESLDNGKSIRETRDLDIPLVARHFYHRSEEHTSELQSRFDIVCRLLLEKKNIPVGLSGLIIIIHMMVVFY